MHSIAKATTKGQITLPVRWRRKYNTSQFLVVERGDRLEISPIDLERAAASQEYTVFDAIRDNQGQGITASKLKELLEKIG